MRAIDSELQKWRPSVSVGRVKIKLISRNIGSKIPHHKISFVKSTAEVTDLTNLDNIHSRNLVTGRCGIQVDKRYVSSNKL